jgi:GT2 family glycosyltransferase
MAVGIAVPSLNQGRFLGAALDSLRDTRAHVWRAVLDAGSSDGSRDLIAARASELAFWRSAPDTGQAAAVNEGIDRLCAEHAEIEVVGWLNADDFFLEGGLDRLSRQLVDHPDWVAVSGRAALASETGVLTGEIPTAPFSLREFARACTICQPATFVRRSAWEQAGGLDATLDMCFDYDLWWRLARTGPIGYLDQVVAASRDHETTKTRQRRQRYFREATAIVQRETGTIPWHWYISEALERRSGYQVGQRPGWLGSLTAAVDAGRWYVADRLGRRTGDRPEWRASFRSAPATFPRGAVPKRFLGDSATRWPRAGTRCPCGPPMLPRSAG